MAQRITALYTTFGLPAFYIHVFFIQLDNESFLIGGKSVTNFVRLTVQHLARVMAKPHEVNAYFQGYEAAVAPFIKEKGYDWEVKKF